jgi:hypothetical protein
MPTTPPSQPSIKVIVRSPRRGGTVDWSNRWFFTGAALTLAQFNALVAALQAEYILTLPTTSTIIEYVQYDPGSDVPVRTSSVSVAGTLAATGRQYLPSECVWLMRFSTSQRTAKNHPIYLFKYMHAAMEDTSGNGDSIAALQKSRGDSFANDVVSGFSDGTSTRHVTGPYGAVAIGQTVSPYVHHRDFPT